MSTFKLGFHKINFGIRKRKTFFSICETEKSTKINSEDVEKVLL